MIGLSDFIAEANLNGYASGSEGIKEDDSSTTFIYEKGKFRSHDNFFGGEPYGGRQVVFENDLPVWIMVYYGAVTPGHNLEEVYGYLKKVLALAPNSLRGPLSHKEGDYEYKNEASGNDEEFDIHETISHKGQLIYEARFIGGLVDRIKE